MMQSLPNMPATDRSIYTPPPGALQSMPPGTIGYASGPFASQSAMGPCGSYAGGPPPSYPGGYASGPLGSVPNVGGPPPSMPLGSVPNVGPPAASMPVMGGTQPQMAGPGPAMGATMSMGAGGPPPLMGDHSQAQYMSNVSRPQMAAAANPPIVANNIAYGPSYKMQYQRRSTADKTAVKYTGFLPLEGVYEEDTCRIG